MTYIVNFLFLPIKVLHILRISKKKINLYIKP